MRSPQRSTVCLPRTPLATDLSATGSYSRQNIHGCASGVSTTGEHPYAYGFSGGIALNVLHTAASGRDGTL